MRVVPLGSAPSPLQSLIARRWRPQWICQDCRRGSIRRRSIASTTTTTTADPSKPFYITAPIFYANAAPHVGHLYSMLLADVLKRWHQLRHPSGTAILCTGTDEHGVEIQQAAVKAGLEPQQLCDRGAEGFQELAANVDISNDVFARTTDPKHKRAVEYAWQMLERERYIYERTHEGWYSVADEAFYQQGQVQLIVDPPTGRKIMVSIETGNAVELTKERSYHFRLSMFKDLLLDFYNRTPTFIVPQERMNEVIKEVQAGLVDLPISHPLNRLSWGVRVPSDSSQTMFAWFSALLSHATAIGYPFTPGLHKAAGWSPDVQVTGKDAMRLYCIYWPAVLMGLNLPLPKQILVHAHWTLGNKRMRNVDRTAVNPFFALERFGVDTMRYFLIRQGGVIDDAAYSNLFIIRTYKTELQQLLGSLVSLLTRFQGWSVARAVQKFGGASSDCAPDDKSSRALCDRIRKAPARVEMCMQSLRPKKALQTIMLLVEAANAHFDRLPPTKLARSSPLYKRDTPIDNEPAALQHAASQIGDRLDRIIYLDAEALRVVGILLQPFMPDAARKLLDMLGVSKDRRSWEWCELGADEAYGVPMVDLGQGETGVLFPGLTSGY
ncbi:tRNA synthetases class I (M)-domain-containing protein [Neohortaea acidophila]|uniref:Probable methionine--tRNA ligase, mitochondrial n=1 Tax=Neohortaea acidophila TaxID=245834 RepID=A0A6A6PLA7_9PEZI|nr:tRNA synthetases class I (M)-domain-containing protein [Neohortaea acidophila]KAF2480772.1 tRNA synthetases class I (M)-domain-containing protein [Neohortaea acidophila]